MSKEPLTLIWDKSVASRIVFTNPEGDAIEFENFDDLSAHLFSIRASQSAYRALLVGLSVSCFFAGYGAASLVRLLSQ